MFSFPPELSIKYILNHLSEEEIFERYTGEPIVLGELFCSPLRIDRNPTCEYRVVGGRLYFRDYNGHFKGDCFELVKFLFQCNLPVALEKIATDFNLIDSNVSVTKKPHIYIEKVEKPPSIIQIKSREFKNSDLKYWTSYGIKQETLLHFNVKAVLFAWLNKKLHYQNINSDPCYCYLLGSKHKLYFPERSKFRFLTNHSGLQGYDQLPKTGDLLIVTKSYKDIMFLYQLDIPSVAPPSESVGLSKEQYEELSKRFKVIKSLYDPDEAGLKTANQMKEEFGIEELHIKDPKAKDPTDLVKYYNYEKAMKITKKVIYGI